jgi:hypothetical protein
MIKNEIVQFVTEDKHLLNFEECLPKTANKFIPQWWKDIPANIPGTVKKCPSFSDIFSIGYVIPMWSDVRLSYDGLDWNWQIADSNYKVEVHDNNQFLDYAEKHIDSPNNKFIFKLVSPWSIITKPGWSVLQIPLFYNFNNDFQIMSGIIDSDIYHELNIQILYQSKQDFIEIKRGDPLCLYVPIKRDYGTYSFREQTIKDTDKIQIAKRYAKGTFYKNMAYRKLQRKRDSR